MHCLGVAGQAVACCCHLDFVSLSRNHFSFVNSSVSTPLYLARRVCVFVVYIYTSSSLHLVNIHTHTARVYVCVCAVPVPDMFCPGFDVFQLFPTRDWSSFQTLDYEYCDECQRMSDVRFRCRDRGTRRGRFCFEFINARARQQCHQPVEHLYGSAVANHPRIADGDQARDYLHRVSADDKSAHSAQSRQKNYPEGESIFFTF